MKRLQVIVGSTRPERQADIVARWVNNRATAHGAFAVEILDLRDWPLPMFAEGIKTIGDFANPTYSDPLVKRWNQKIAEADAYLFITPEYNHSIPAILKNAIDSVFVSLAFRNKPAVFVGYSGGQIGGARAVEHLAHIAIEAELVPLRNTVLISTVQAGLSSGRNPCRFAFECRSTDRTRRSRLVDRGSHTGARRRTASTRRHADDGGALDRISVADSGLLLEDTASLL